VFESGNKIDQGGISKMILRKIEKEIDVAELLNAMKQAKLKLMQLKSTFATIKRKASSYEKI